MLVETFLLAVQVLVSFSRDRVQQLVRPFSLLVRNAFLSGSWSRSWISPFLVETFLLVEVFAVYAHDMVSRPEHAHDAPRRSRRGGGPVGGPPAPSQDRAQQPEVELVIGGMLVVSSSCLEPEVAASSSPVRRPSSAEQPLVGSESPSRGRGTSP